MRKKSNIVLLLLVLSLSTWYLITKENSATQIGITTSVATTSKQYSSLLYGISFTYQASNFIFERDSGTSTNSVHSIFITEDKKTNRSFFEGKDAFLGDGPPVINIEIYSNEKRTNTQEWLKKNTEWSIRDKIGTPIVIGQKNGYIYSTDGLYRGKLIMVNHEGYVYRLSVDWISPEDKLVKDFDELVESIVFVK